MKKYLYHYTTLGCLEKIFTDPEGTYIDLKLKDYHFLNDGYEGKWLVRFMETCKDAIVGQFKLNERLACEKAIKDFVECECYRMLLKEQNDKHYSFSMSELKDSMLFWRQDYAKDNGIALCTEKSDFEKKSKLTVEQVRYLGAETLNEILPDFVAAVEHDAQYIKSRSDLRSDITDMLKGAKSLANTDFLRVKNITWEAEKEWRIIITQKFEGKKNLLKMEEIEIDEKSKYIPRYRMRIENPFNEIILGPTFSNYYVEAVSEWFDRKHYKIKVSKSLG